MRLCPTAHGGLLDHGNHPGVCDVTHSHHPLPDSRSYDGQRHLRKLHQGQHSLHSILRIICPLHIHSLDLFLYMFCGCCTMNIKRTLVFAVLQTYNRIILADI